MMWDCHPFLKCFKQDVFHTSVRYCIQSWSSIQLYVLSASLYKTFPPFCTIILYTTHLSGILHRKSAFNTSVYFIYVFVVLPKCIVYNVRFNTLLASHTPDCRVIHVRMTGPGPYTYEERPFVIQVLLFI